VPGIIIKIKGGKKLPNYHYTGSEWILQTVKKEIQMAKKAFKTIDNTGISNSKLDGLLMAIIKRLHNNEYIMAHVDIEIMCEKIIEQEINKLKV